MIVEKNVWEIPLYSGQAGSGKTMLMTFLMTQLDKFRHTSTFLPTSVKRELITMVYLDKDYGAEACIRAMGGKYMLIRKVLPTGFNPFMCETHRKTCLSFQR